MFYTPRISITLMRYIPVRGHAKVQVCTSRGVHEFLLSFFLQSSMCTRVNTGTCVRTLYKRGYINYPRIIVSAHNTLYVCKTAKTNTVPTTRMLRKRLCPALGARHSRLRVLYVRRVINANSFVNPARIISSKVPGRGPLFRSSRFRSPPVIKSPMASFFLQLLSSLFSFITNWVRINFLKSEPNGNRYDANITFHLVFISTLFDLDKHIFSVRNEITYQFDSEKNMIKFSSTEFEHECKL